MQPQSINLKVDNHQLTAVCLNPGASGEPVILLHGITGTISFWQVNPAQFILDLGPCYALSLPGHYPATAPATFTTAPLNADGLVHLLGEALRRLIGKRPATLIGHSTGGFAALALAAYRPETARGVVSISGFARGHWTGILGLYQRIVRLGWPGETYFKVMYQMLKLHPALFHWAMRFYAADTRALYAHPDLPEAIERTFPNFRRLDLGAMLPYFKHMPQIDITSQLSCIQAPTLLITGDRDPIVPPTQSEQIARLVKGAELAVMRGAGHLPFIERYSDYNQHVSEWLALHN